MIFEKASRPAQGATPSLLGVTLAPLCPHCGSHQDKPTFRPQEVSSILSGLSDSLSLLTSRISGRSMSILLVSGLLVGAVTMMLCKARTPPTYEQSDDISVRQSRCRSCGKAFA